MIGQLTSESGWKIDKYGDYVSLEGKDRGKDRPDGVEFKPFGVIAIAAAIPDVGALTSLNLSSNILKAEGGKIVAEAIKVTTYTTAVVLTLVELLLFAAIHRIMGHCPRLS